MFYHFTDVDKLMKILYSGGIFAKVSETDKERDLGLNLYIGGTKHEDFVYHNETRFTKFSNSNVSLEIDTKNYATHEVDYKDVEVDDRVLQHIFRENIYEQFLHLQNKNDDEYAIYEYIKGELLNLEHEKETIILSDEVDIKDVVAVHYYHVENDLGIIPEAVIHFSQDLNIPLVVHTLDGTEVISPTDLKVVTS